MDNWLLKLNLENFTKTKYCHDEEGDEHVVYALNEIYLICDLSLKFAIFNVSHLTN